MFHKTVFPFIYKYDSGVPGPTVTIMGGVHGNEVCGVEAFYWLKTSFLKEHNVAKGKIYIVLGNYKAVDQHTRYVEEDMNRLFGLGGRARDSFEKRRVQQIEQILDESNYFLDIHSTSSPSVPMTCSYESADHLELCSALGVEYMTTGWGGNVEGMASDEYLGYRNGLGILVECGSHYDDEAIQFAKQAVLRFLNHLEIIDSDTKPIEKPAQHIRIQETIYPESKNFKFTVPEIASFVPVHEGDTFAVDEGKKYTSPLNGLLVMPSKVIEPGKEACFLAKIV